MAKWESGHSDEWDAKKIARNIYTPRGAAGVDRQKSNAGTEENPVTNAILYCSATSEWEPE